MRLTSTLLAITLTIATVLACPRDAVAMATATLDEIITGDAPADGFVIYRWEDTPAVVIIHFDTYLYQSHALSRMAMYQEMTDGRGRIMSQAELEQWFSERGCTMEGLFGAHDYRTTDLARFYNALWQSGETPWPEELAVADALVSEGLLSLAMPEGGTAPARAASPYTAPGSQAVLSFATRLALPESQSQLQGQPGRDWEASALYHESRHGIFFTDADYAERCTEFWQQRLSTEERRGLRIILGSLSYDAAFEELMVNEFQAYLLSPAGPGSGPNILIGRAQLLLTDRFQPQHVSDGDKAFFRQHGAALVERMKNGLGDELRDWLEE